MCPSVLWELALFKISRQFPGSLLYLSNSFRWAAITVALLLGFWSLFVFQGLSKSFLACLCWPMSEVETLFPQNKHFYTFIPISSFPLLTRY